MLTDIIVNFTHAAVVVFGLLTLLWAIGVLVRDASLIDIFWGFGFLVVAATCLCLAPAKTSYVILLAALPIIWGARLTLYLARRNLGHGEDKRYLAMQKRAEKKGMSEMRWRLRSLFTIFFGQGLLIMIVSAPIWVAMATGIDNSNSLDLYKKLQQQGIGSDDSWLMLPAIPGYETIVTPIGIFAIIGALLWLVGFLFEAIGDWQLSRFLKKNKDYNGPIDNKPVLDTGLWKYTRHPNYFGNSLMWWGIWLVACQAPWGWATIFAPILMTLLLTKVSGRDLLERDLGRRKNYQDYIARTSGFIPRRPKPNV